MDTMEKWFERAKNTVIAYAAIMGVFVVVLLAMVVLKFRMTTIVGVLIGFVTAMICSTISRYFEEEDTKKVATRATTIGILYAVIYATVGKTPAWLAMIMLIISFAVMGYLIYWWNQEGSTVKELVVFILLNVLILWGLAMPAAAAIRDITQIGWVIAVVESLPKMLFIVSVGYFIANMIWFRQELDTLEGGE